MNAEAYNQGNVLLNVYLSIKLKICTPNVSEGTKFKEATYPGSIYAYLAIRIGPGSGDKFCHNPVNFVTRMLVFAVEGTDS